MKEKFVSPEVTKVEFDPKDVITTSGCVQHTMSWDRTNGGGSACEDYEKYWTDDNT